MVKKITKKKPQTKFSLKLKKSSLLFFRYNHPIFFTVLPGTTFPSTTDTPLTDLSPLIFLISFLTASLAMAFTSTMYVLSSI